MNLGIKQILEMNILSEMEECKTIDDLEYLADELIDLIENSKIAIADTIED